MLEEQTEINRESAHGGMIFRKSGKWPGHFFKKTLELVSIYLMRSYLTDSNLPGIYWDYVVEHAALVNSMITPSITDKSRTIFEHVWGVVPNLDLIPPIGWFAARPMDNSARTDWKLDPKNQSGVFLGFAHNRNVYGAQILVENAIIDKTCAWNRVF